MFKNLRIKHEGLHRIGIASGIILVILSAWLAEGIFDGSIDNFDFVGILDWQLKMWDESLSEGGIFFFAPFLVYLISYSIGYFLVKLFYWIIEGFKKNN